MKGCLRKTGIACVAAVLGFASLAWSETETVQLEDISFATLPGDRFEVKLQFSDTPPEPKGYTIDNPARIVLDFPNVESVLQQKKYALSFENARSVVVLSTADRTRVILNMQQLTSYETAVNGKEVTIVVGNTEGIVATQSHSSSITGVVASASTTDMVLKSAVTNVDFHRGENGEGLVTIDLSDPKVSVDISQVGSDIRLSFFRTSLPDMLDRRLDVVDFATPVREIDASQDGTTTTIVIDAMGEYDYMAYQADGQYVVSVKPLTVDDIAEKKKRFAYTGDKLSLNFQDIEVRSVLQLIADFTDLNLVASDTVAGRITLRLNDVPWDQALAIILKAKGLDKRQEGNVLMVAPAAEIAERERLQVEANKQLQELAPLRTEFIRVRYADAVELFELFDAGRNGGGGGDGTATASILSARGSAIVDERTNTIILTDTEDKIAEFKRLINEIDIPIRQVLIEARIVIAGTDFLKELGVSWSADGTDEHGDGDIFGYSGSVDLGVSNPAGSLGLQILSDNLSVDLEISALENEGMGEIISQPKILTGDKQKAVIKAGSEVPYSTVSADGTDTEFKEVVLKLEVTPQITPDNHIIMDLMITQDSISGLAVNGEPIIDVTSIETQVLVGDGQTLVLGGLFQQTSVSSVEKVPLLGDIPFIGRLFRKTLENIEKREILIFITPKIVDDALLD